MQVLIICSKRQYAPYSDYMAPFIYDQVQAVGAAKGEEIKFETFFVEGGKGVRAYISAFFRLRKRLQTNPPDILHAHYGLCGALACAAVRSMKRKVPVVVTFHGSDVNDKGVRHISAWAVRQADKAIYVSQPLYEIAGKPDNGTVLPCGVDTASFRPMDKAACRKALGLDSEYTYILFSKHFNDKVKNYPLARAAVDNYQGRLQAEDNKLPPVLLEFKGYSREQVPMLFNAVDASILTSFTEGSPQFVKEAVACGCPIVSVDVGDVACITKGVANCRVVAPDAEQLGIALHECIALGHCAHTELPDMYRQTTIVESLTELYRQLYTKD